MVKPRDPWHISIIMNDGMSVPQNNVMDLNNVMRVSLFGFR